MWEALPNSDRREDRRGSGHHQRRDYHVVKLADFTARPAADARIIASAIKPATILRKSRKWALSAPRRTTYSRVRMANAQACAADARGRPTDAGEWVADAGQCAADTGQCPADAGECVVDTGERQSHGGQRGADSRVSPSRTSPEEGATDPSRVAINRCFMRPYRAGNSFLTGSRGGVPMNRDLPRATFCNRCAVHSFTRRLFPALRRLLHIFDRGRVLLIYAATTADACRARTPRG